MNSDISNNLYIEMDSDNEFRLGNKVEHKWKNTEKWFPGKISRIETNDEVLLYTLDMDDGDTVCKVKSETIRKPEKVQQDKEEELEVKKLAEKKGQERMKQLINNSVNLNPILETNKEYKLLEVLKNVIFNKPEKHNFNIDEKSYIKKRFMNTTGG